jgi:hypothetical protein
VRGRSCSFVCLTAVEAEERSSIARHAVHVHGKPFEPEEDCHMFKMKLAGTAGAAAWAMLEARP